MLFVLLYCAALLVILGHFTGWFARHNLEWVLMLAGVLAFPAVILL